jgi:hypothetical protein
MANLATPASPRPSDAVHRLLSAVAARPNLSWPSDLESTAQIRSHLSQPSQIPVNQARFANKPLCFIKINLSSSSVEKNLQNSHFFYVLTPEYMV